MRSNGLSTRQSLDKIPNVVGLYRHRNSGAYYGIKKLGGKRKEHSLGTTDRKIAERRLKTWLSKLEMLDAETERTTLNQLLEKLTAMKRGEAAKTQATNLFINQTVPGDLASGARPQGIPSSAIATARVVSAARGPA